MKLREINISNFKSIKDSGWVTLNTSENITVLAGQNESGKSAFLESIDYLFNGPSEHFVRLQKRQDADITEVMGIVELSKDDKELIEPKIPAEGDKVVFKKLKEIIIHRISSDPHPNEFVITAAEGQEDIELTAELTNVLKEHLPIVSLYTSFKDLLPSEIAVTEIPNSPAVNDFSVVFGVDLQAFAAVTDPRKRTIQKKKIEELAEDDFNKSWSQAIKSLKNQTKYKFILDVNDAEPKKVFFMIEGQDGIPLYLEQKSMGFRWFSSFHLRLRSIRARREQANAKDVILLIDEPGQNLHDAAQIDVKNIIEETANDRTQIIYSTHNPRLIVDSDANNLEFNRIRLVAKDENNFETGIYTIPQFLSSRKGQVVIDTLAPVRAALGLSDVSKLLSTNGKSVIVEGITDHYYFSAIFPKIDASQKFSFVPACGVDNIKHVASLLIGWGYDYRAVLDDDASQGRKAYNLLKQNFFENSDQKTQEKVHKLKGKSGIEDLFSKDFFQNHVIPSEISLTKAEKNLSNSELAKKYSKETLARVFYEKLNNNEIQLDDNSNEAFKKVLDWLKSTTKT